MTGARFVLEPVGRVRAKDGEYAIGVDERYRQGLLGLAGFGHIDVLWWADRAESRRERDRLVLERPYTRGPESIGVFATRSPARPNPVAVTTVAVLSVDCGRGEIRIPYIDALDGTPVIDIKPYHPSAERVKNPEVPAWCSSWPQWYEESGTFDWSKEFAD